MLSEYSYAMWILPKILKPPYANLRQKGHLSAVFVNDSYLEGDFETECLGNVEPTVSLLKYLGFNIHEAKPILKQTQRIESLGFINDLTKMTVIISKDKMIAIANKIKKLMATTFPAISLLPSVMSLNGSVISLFLAVSLGKLHYRALEKDKTVALKQASRNVDKIVEKVSVKATKLNWWLTEIPHARMNIHLPDIDFTIHTDASKISMGATDGNSPTNDKWIEEKGNHINYLELKAIFLAVKSYSRYWLGKKHVQVKSDNTTAVAHINNMGGSVVFVQSWCWIWAICNALC